MKKLFLRGQTVTMVTGNSNTFPYQSGGRIPMHYSVRGKRKKMSWGRRQQPPNYQY